VQSEAERTAALAARGKVPASRLSLAALLLTESALAELDRAGFAQVRPLLRGAGVLVGSAPTANPPPPFERRFYLLAGLAAHASGELELAHPLLLEARHRFDPDDPEIVTALGAVLEQVATLREYDPSPDCPHGRGRPGGFASEYGASGFVPNASLRGAESSYTQALELAPALAEARLHLGRVRLLQGRPDDALQHLDRVASEAQLASQRALARMFAGRAHEARGDGRAAVEAYEAATVLAPESQSALLALARALDALGDTQRVQQALSRIPDASGEEDPWQDYLGGQRARLHDLLDELRRLQP
jgi:tetratricopeptide (TPR) repeat protein